MKTKRERRKLLTPYTGGAGVKKRDYKPARVHPWRAMGKAEIREREIEKRNDVS